MQSVANPDRYYVGLATDVAASLREHNLGQSPQTVRHRPWKVVAYAGFASPEHAERVARDLKSSSARGLVHRYFT